VEDFLASSDTQQEVVSSILSGVVHKYILRASDLDIRIPEMLLRECERELLKVSLCGVNLLLYYLFLNGVPLKNIMLFLL